MQLTNIILLSIILLILDCCDRQCVASARMNQSEYEHALSMYKEYSAIREHCKGSLLLHEVPFEGKKHLNENEYLSGIKDRYSRIICEILCCALVLLLLSLASWLYYCGYHNRKERVKAEKENVYLKLEHDNLRKEKERALLERNEMSLEVINLKKYIMRLEAAQNRCKKETANLLSEKLQLKKECENLMKLLKKQSELAVLAQRVIKIRLGMLNGLLAKEITNNEKYANKYNKWIETVHNDKKEFMNSTRLAFTASHPMFMDYLDKHGLSTDEVNYLCLYAIGLSGKEVGEYVQLKRHYNVSSEIRKKLGIGEHETNIGIYVRRLMLDLEKNG